MVFLSDSSWKSWEKTGRLEFVKTFQSLLPSENYAIDESSKLNDIRKAINELLWKYLRGHLKRDQTLQIIGEMTTFHSELGSVIIDTISLVDIESGMLVNEKERDEVRDRLLSLIKESERYLSSDTLKERMEIETLGSAGIVKNSKKFFSTVIKTKTKLFYKQQKFNLFREECEGYAKLITELNQDLTTTTPADMLKLIKSVIGFFNLDPNRVLDIILESFECQLDQHEFFVELLNLFMPDKQTMNELLGFKYKFYMTEDNGKNGEVPESLFKQTALMIQHGILEMNVIYNLLGPSDEAIEKMAMKELSDAKELVRKMNIVSTNNQDSAKKEDDSTDSSIEDPESVVASNQKLGLLKALLDVGAWSQAESLIQGMPQYYAVSQPSIAMSLAHLIHVTMAPVHARYSRLDARIKTKKYWPLNKNDPQARTLEEFQELVLPMLLTLGPYAYHDSVLLYKVIRILKTALKIEESSKDRDKIAEPVDPEISCLYYDIITILDEVMLPATSLMETPNCGLAEEIWSIMRVYPYQVRYRLYGSWKGEAFSNHAALMMKKGKIQKSIKRIMQRISKENVKPTSRALAKLSHSAPGLLFDYVLSQIQLYDNLIGPVVDSLKYLTNLSFDVLGYSIIEALNNPEKDRTKHDGTSISLWLQSLSNFCGAIFKKYNIELTGILQYVANQLKSKRSLDLLILKEVVLKMSGIEAAEDMTDEQIDAMAGGELLRQEAGSFNQVKNTKKSSQRLKDALIDNNLAVPLCLLMAQQRNCVVYQETENSHLKLVGILFDQCQDTLVQFGQFLATNLSVDDYTLRLPPMDQLLTLYHVNSDLAFFLARPMFNHQISLKCEEMRKKDPKFWKNDKEKGYEGYVQAVTEVMNPVIDAIRPLHSNKVWDDISPQFLTTFWSLTMYDLFVPETVYEKEISKLKAAPARIDENKELNASRKKKEKERIHNLMEKLIDEQKRQRDHVERVMARLRAEKDTWFLSRSVKLAKNETITTFLQLFLFPRCIFTANDAIYCAKFVQVIHSLRTPYFPTLICFDRIFCDITYTVTSCTENEAQRYGRFLEAMLGIVMRWHKSKDVFEQECAGYPGFVTKFRVTTSDAQGDKDSKDHVDYENYRHVVHKWYFKIAKALVVCLESKDYVQIRNALIILTRILPHFPVIVKLHGVIEKRIEKVCEEEKESRKDLYVKAMSYSGQLKARKKHVMREHEFHQVDAKPDEMQEDEPPKKAAKKEITMKETSTTRDSKSRSQSREKSTPRREREKSEDRKPNRKERESKSKDRTIKEKKKEEGEIRSERAKSKEKRDMGPPQSTSLPRKSVEPVEDSARKRKSERSSSPSEDRKHKREKSEPVSPPSVKKDRKPERKRERDEDDKKKRSLTDPDPIENVKQNGETSSDRKGRASSSSSSSSRRSESKRK